MDTKRFIGPDMRTALRMVREQLGPDAVILSNRRVGAGVEILAADSMGPADAVDAPLHAAEPGVSRAVPGGYPSRTDTSAPRADAAASRASHHELDAMRGELRELRSLMERQLAAPRQGGENRAPGAEGAAWRHLTRAGIPNDVVRLLVDVLDGSAPEDALAISLARMIPEAGDRVAGGGAIAAVGPTGAGKTTTLCKLAVRYVLEHGRESVVLASADSARLGGTDMLRSVARLLDVPFLVAAEDESIAALIARAGDPALLLLDTPGLSRRRPADEQRLRELAAAGVNSLVVLPANAQLAWLDAAVGDYRPARPVAAVVTKLDETVSLGEVLGVLLREGLPLAYVTDGPEIPDDLQVCDAADFANRVLELGERGPSTTPRPAAASPNAARIA